MTNTKETILHNSIYIKQKMDKTKPRLLFERKVGAIIGIKNHGNVLFPDSSNDNTNMFTLW